MTFNKMRFSIILFELEKANNFTVPSREIFKRYLKE